MSIETNTLETLLCDLRAMGANENTLQLARNCYNVGAKDQRERLFAALTKQPLNDTAHSIAIWIREQT